MDSEQTLRPNTYLFNRTYRIVKVLGRGGFGITYLAINEVLRTFVAIKECFPKGIYNRDVDSVSVSPASSDGQVLSDGLKEKFLKEARRLAQIHHENIVAVTNAFEENGTAYYVMDYIEGRDLNRITEVSGHLKAETALKYIRQVCNALNYLHSQRINHLDIKPGNIVVDSASDKAILIDFGLSKHYDDSGQETSKTLGGVSAGYAPIEQYKRRGVNKFNPSTDIYSLGATLYYLLTGIRPPEATDLGEEALIFPSFVPTHLQNVILKAMSYFKGDRYQDVDSFLTALTTTAPVRGKSSAKNQTTRLAEPETSDNQSKKMWLTIVVLILLLVVIVNIVVYLVLDGNKPSEPAQAEPSIYEISYDEPVPFDPEEKPEPEIDPSRLEMALSVNPKNLDLLVCYKGKLAYISMEEWKTLSDAERDLVEKRGVYVQGEVDDFNGDYDWDSKKIEFIVALKNETDERISWQEAINRYEGILPNAEQATVINEKVDNINKALAVYGGEIFQEWDPSNGKYSDYWTNHYFNNSGIVFSIYTMSGGETPSKYSEYYVRGVSEVPDIIY